jgi:UDP-N-acetylmuramyl pentapeptide synthase
LFKIEEVLEATGGTLVREGARDSFTGVLTDSRKLAPGCLFVAIKGANFDGHDFVEEAVKQGASGVVVEHRVSISGSASVVQVDDTLKALGKLAGYHRRRFDVPVIALTGSNGKTTTKEMLLPYFIQV